MDLQEGKAALRSMMIVIFRCYRGCVDHSRCQNTDSGLNGFEAGSNGQADPRSRGLGFFDTIRKERDRENERCGCGVTAMLCTSIV